MSEKKPRRKLPTQRTLEACRSRGWLAGVVERFNHHTKLRHDLFGFIDIIAIDGQPGAIGIQACGAGGHAAERLEKIRTECREAAARWLESGNRIQIWAWRKVGGAGRRQLWEPRIVSVVLKLTLSETLDELPF